MGKVGLHGQNNYQGGTAMMTNFTGVFYGPIEIRYSSANVTDGAGSIGELRIDSGRTIPIADETNPSAVVMNTLLRIA